jgi:ATP-dependent DNA helicase RecG
MEPENQHIEWKEGWKDDFLKHICAFANSLGGRLFIGLTDQGKIKGVANPEKLLEDIPNKVIHLLGISVKVKLLHEKGKPYIEIDVAVSTAPVSFRGLYYVRSGSTVQELKGAELRQFILHKDNLTWDKISEPEANPDDLDETSLGRFTQRAVIANRMSHETGTGKWDILLRNLDLVTGKDHITRAAVILFGKRPLKFFRNIQFKIGRFGETASDLLSQDTIECNAFEMPHRVLELLRNKYLQSIISYQGLERIETLEYPETALREAIINSIVHRDYSIPADITLSIFKNRLVLWNPGTLMEPLNIEMLKTNHPSLRRNPLISNVFFRAGYIEAWGRGTLSILKETGNAGFPEPEFKEYADGFELTFFSKHPVPGKIKPRPTGFEINHRQVKALEYLAVNEWVTNEIFQQINQCSRNIATKDLQELFVHKLIVREGKGRYTKYRLN